LIPAYTIDITQWLPDAGFAGVVVPPRSGVVGSLISSPSNPCRLLVALVCDTGDVPSIDHSNVYLFLSNQAVPGVIGPSDLGQCPFPRSNSRLPGENEWTKDTTTMIALTLVSGLVVPGDAILPGYAYTFARSSTGSTLVTQTFSFLGNQSVCVWSEAPRPLAVYVGRSLATPTS
jgi:hypothetical protein